MLKKYRRIIGLLLVFVIAFVLFAPAAVHASVNATSGKVSLESDVSSCINDMVSGFFSGKPGQYKIGEAIAIYNADVRCTYYIVPVFHNATCVATVEVGTNGSVVLSDKVSLYNTGFSMTNSGYFLYTTGGITYAEKPNEIIELYQSGFEVDADEVFLRNTYADKKAEITKALALAQTQIDISSVITQCGSITPSESVMRGAVPPTVMEGCDITNFVTQGDDGLCWAACVATIVNYKKSLSLTARNVSEAMGHDADNDPGADVYETKDAVNRYGLSYRAFAGKLTWSNVKTYIEDDYPFIIGLLSIYEDAFGNTITRWHMVTGYGYECSYGDASVNANQRYVNIWDPNGSHLTLRYNASTYSIDGYQWIWHETVAD